MCHQHYLTECRYRTHPRKLSTETANKSDMLMCHQHYLTECRYRTNPRKLSTETANKSDIYKFGMHDNCLAVEFFVKQNMIKVFHLVQPLIHYGNE